MLRRIYVTFRRFLQWLIIASFRALQGLLKRLWKIISNRYFRYTLLFLLIVIVFIWSGYQLFPTASNFGAKKWWDWLDLIIVPLVLAGGGIAINSTVQQTERKRAQDTLMDSIFQSYLDDMATLLIEKELQKELDKNTDEESSPVVTVARARTVTALRSLDQERRGLCLNFLREAKLITGEKGTLFVNVHFGDVDLSGANLREANLSGANLYQADLSRAFLYQANLSDAYLWGANLSNALLTETNLSNAILAGTNLSNSLLRQANLSNALLANNNLSGFDLSLANLSGADLSQANLKGAYLYQANLSDANLWGANLSDTNLREANLSSTNLYESNLSNAENVTDEQLARAIGFYDTTMPDGRKYGEKWETHLMPLRPRTLLMEMLKNKDDISQLDLSYADLSELDLSNIDLSGLDLRGANLTQTNLSSANLSQANLGSANLYQANLSSTNLYQADLSKANLEGTHQKYTLAEGIIHVLSDIPVTLINRDDIREIDLSESENLTAEQLAQTASLEGATMPDGTKYDEEWEKYLAPFREQAGDEE